MLLLLLIDDNVLVGRNVYHRATAAVITVKLCETHNFFLRGQQDMGEQLDARRLSLSSDNASPPCPPILLLVTTIVLLSLSVAFERNESE